jgi:acetyl-CoA carboxylase carboxyltransferase component
MDINGRQFKKFLERQESHQTHHKKTAVKLQHSKGKLTAQERIELLFDPNTFNEIDAFSRTAFSDSHFGKMIDAYGDGVIIGYGKIAGRTAFAIPRLSR